MPLKMNKLILLIWSILISHKLSDDSLMSCLDLKDSGLINLNVMDLNRTNNLTKLILSFNKITNIDLLAKFKNLKYIDLSHNKLIRNIDSLAMLVDLEYLDLSSNRIITLNSLQYLKNLTTLKINYNQIVTIDNFIQHAINMNYLDLTANRIQKISDYLINKLSNLKTLYLSKNSITNIKINNNSSNLNVIRLDYNQIDELSTIELPFSLEEIDLSNNNIRLFNLNGNFSKLLRLYLKKNQIENWYHSALFPNLIHLELSFNRIKNIEFLTKSFSNLEAVYLNNNQIENIDALSHLTRIETLFLNENKIKNPYPLKANRLTSYLEMDYNQLEDICWVKYFNNLDSLSLSNNNIKDLQCLSYQSHHLWNNMIYLNLSYNLITDISSLENFTRLSILYLYNNQIEDIKSLSSMKQLRILSLNSNKITSIESIKEFNKLRLLNISENEIEDIRWIKNLTSLWTLELARNKISFIPIGLFDNLKSLTKLDLSFNFIKKFDSLGPYLFKIIRTIYLNNNQLNELIYLGNFCVLNELKVNNNNIEDINSFNISSNELQTIDISFNSFQYTKKNNSFLRIGQNLKTVFVDFNLIELFDNLKNDRSVNRQIELFKFHKSLFIITQNMPDFVDCKLQLKYSRNMIQLNLFYSFQIQNFLLKCKNYILL